MTQSDKNNRGCGYCQHITPDMRCRHPDAGPIPVPIEQARDGGGQGAKGGVTAGGHCGPNAVHWVAMGEA